MLPERVEVFLEMHACSNKLKLIIEHFMLISVLMPVILYSCIILLP